MPGRGGWSKGIRLLAALGIVCLLTAGCTAEGGEPVAATPTSSDGSRQPEPRRNGETIVSRGGDLVGVDPDTGLSRTLVDGEDIQGRIGNAAWSPDGAWLAYDIPGCGGDAGLWVSGAQGEPRPLRMWDCPGFGDPWAWSPSGGQLVILNVYTDGHRVILVDPSTGRETSLSDTVGDVTTGPVWSPDGRWIAYGARGGLIYSVDVESGDRSLFVRLPGNFDSVDGIEWSPDGGHVAILVDLVGALRRLYVVNADGSDLRAVVDNFEPGGWPAWFPDPSSVTAWSPDGTQLTYPEFSGPDDRELRIWTVSLDDSVPSLVAAHTNDECCIDGGSPVWSPDGSQIAFEIDSSRLVVNSDGTGGPRHIDELTYLSWRGGWYFCFCYG
jgi:Tol biopolymer transport system component